MSGSWDELQLLEATKVTDRFMNENNFPGGMNDYLNDSFARTLHWPFSSTVSRFTKLITAYRQLILSQINHFW